MVPHSGEQGRGAVDVGEPAGANAAGGEREEFARVDGAEVGDEHEPLPGVDVRRRAAGLPPGQAEVAEPLPQPQIQLAQAEHGEVVGAARAEDLALEDDAAEVVGLGGPRRDELSGVVDEVEHVLGLPRGQCGQQRAPPGRDEQERALRRRTQTVDQRGDVRQAGEVVGR